jgi:site-specific recombinase XerD
MKLYNVFDQNNKQYFGLDIFPTPATLEIVRTLKNRNWHKNSKLWLVPYDVEHWKEIKAKLPITEIEIVKDAMRIEYGVKVNKERNYLSHQQQVPKIKIELSDAHKECLLLMKEQLIINRYSFSTQKTYLSCFTEFLYHYPNEDVKQINKEMIKDFLMYKINTENISESTQNCLINAIKFYYEKVEKRERFVLYDLRPRRSFKIPGFLSKEEVTKIIKGIKNEKHKLIIMLIYSAGLRLGELTRMKINDIKWDTNQIFIKCSKGKKDRMVTLSDKVKIAIKDYIEKYKPTYYLIQGQDGGNYAYRSVQNVFHKALEEAKIETHATVHTLRHSYATHLILNGKDIRAVQELLGHSSIKTTEIYTHITDQNKPELFIRKSISV